MALSNFTLILLIVTVVILVIDIALALALCLVLPKHVIEINYYSADNRKLPYEEAIKICPCLIRDFPAQSGLIEFSSYKNSTLSAIHQGENEQPTPPPARRRRTVQKAITKTYSFLVSLNIPAYNDDTSKILACNGLITSKDTLITSRDCVKDHTEWMKITVRSESDSWTNGKDHEVGKVHYLKNSGLVQLSVHPEFNSAIFVNYPHHQPFLNAYTLGWNDEMYRRPLEYRFLYGGLRKRSWSAASQNNVTINVCQGYPEGCSELSSIPLLTACNGLIGLKFKSGRDDQCNNHYYIFPDVANQDNGTQVKVVNADCFPMALSTMDLEKC